MTTIRFGSKAIVENAPKRFVELASERCSVVNPKYINAVKHSPWPVTRIPHHLYVFENTSEGLMLPRGFPFQDYQMCAEWDVIDERAESPVQYPDLKIDTYISQKYWVEKVLGLSDDPSGCFLMLIPTARGKTIFALALGAKLRQKMLVITHRGLIYDGWMRDAEKFLGISRKQMGQIRGPKWDIGECVTIGMAQTLCKYPDAWHGLFSQFGLVVVDECQIAPWESIMSMLDFCPSKYRIGITATPKRKDGLESLLYLYFGFPIIEQTMEQVETRSSMPVDRAEFIISETDVEYGENYNEFLEGILYDPARNQLIVDAVMKEKGHKCLIITNRQEHAELLHSMLQARTDSELLYGPTGEKEEERIVRKFMAGNGHALVSTDKKMDLGVNIPPLDRLFITVPYPNQMTIEQLIGRIRRKAPNKTDAVVYVVFDHNIGRVRQIMRKHFQTVFKKMKIRNWLTKSF